MNKISIPIDMNNISIPIDMNNILRMIWGLLKI